MEFRARRGERREERSYLCLRGLDAAAGEREEAGEERVNDLLGGAAKQIVDSLLARFLPLARRRIETAQAQVTPLLSPLASPRPEFHHQIGACLFPPSRINNGIGTDSPPSFLGFTPLPDRPSGSGSTL